MTTHKRRKKILIGAIIQESNTFSPCKSKMDDFKRNVYFLGDEIDQINIQNELAGSIQAAHDADVDVLPTVCMSAVSSGVFMKDAFEELKHLLSESVSKAEGYDGIYFAMHGAMVADGCDDVEGELTALIRNHTGNEIPFVLSLDLHANVTEKMVRHVNVIIGYRTFPHADFFETGYRSTKLLLSMVETGEKPAMALCKIPMILPAENSQTTSGPFAELWKDAIHGEKNGESIVTSLFPVQPWLDVGDMGSSIVVVSDHIEKAEREAKRLAQAFWNKRHEFNIKLYSIEQIVADIARRNTNEPFIISDSADSPGAGATSDSTAVLRSLLELGLEADFSSLLLITDAPAVHQAIEAGVGSDVKLTVGHTLNPHSGDPLSVEGRVRRIGDGKFKLNGGYAKNMIMDMGRCIVLEIGKISLLIGEKPVFSGDPNMYRAMGLEPLDADLVMVKSANQFRADYEEISNQIYILDTPGCASANLKKLTFHKLPKPFYPFEDHFEWEPDRTIITSFS